MNVDSYHCEIDLGRDPEYTAAPHLSRVGELNRDAGGTAAPVRPRHDVSIGEHRAVSSHRKGGGREDLCGAELDINHCRSQLVVVHDAAVVHLRGELLKSELLGCIGQLPSQGLDFVRAAGRLSCNELFPQLPDAFL